MFVVLLLVVEFSFIEGSDRLLDINKKLLTLGVLNRLISALSQIQILERARGLCGRTSGQSYLSN
ncbi:MAG TPA: hypothetical protein V6C71_12090 [Coleofasciculaceae cyanobacterium]